MTERALYTISGDIEVAGQSFAYAQLLVLRPGDQIVVRAVTAARVMLFGGEPLEGPRWIWWNFISSRKERIEQAQVIGSSSRRIGDEDNWYENFDSDDSDGD